MQRFPAALGTKSYRDGTSTIYGKKYNKGTRQIPAYCSELTGKECSIIFTVKQGKEDIHIPCALGKQK